MKKRTAVFAPIAAVLLITINCGCDGNSPASSGQTGSVAEMCAQSEEAAHYIAAESVNANDVTRVTDDLIANRKDPQLDDRTLASIGSIVILRRGTETPDEIGAGVKSTCISATSGH